MTSLELPGDQPVSRPGAAGPRRRPDDVEVIGVVDGTRECTTTAFWVVTGCEASVELDDLVAVDQVLPDGDTLTHYGIVIGLERLIEGAS